MNKNHYILSKPIVTQRLAKLLRVINRDRKKDDKNVEKLIIEAFERWCFMCDSIATKIMTRLNFKFTLS